jgi:hypothetical protein
MKRLPHLILLLALTLTACQAAPTQPAPQPVTVARATATPLPPVETPIPSIDWNNRDIFRSGLTETAQAALDELPGATVYHILFEIDPDLYHIKGQQEVYYTNRADIPLDDIYFHLFPNLLGGEMNVTAAQVNGQSVASEYGPEKGYLHLTLEMPLEPGQSLDVQLDFDVTVPQQSDVNYGVFVSTDGVLTLAHSYPMVSVYDDEGWNIAPPSPQADPTYGEASFYLVNVTAPKDLVLVATGSQVGQQTQGNQQTTIFASGPARDFFLAASADFQKISKTTNGITINSYAPADLESGARQAINYASQAIDIFSKRYEPYPYTEFDIVSTPTLALGVEYPGLTAVTNRIYDTNGSLNGTSNSVYLESTVAHEVGHQWFYNMVGNDQLDDPWLDESLTQFATWQYYADKCGQNCADGFEQSLKARWQRVDDAKIPVGMPASEYQGAEYGAIVYGRGALFFEALEQKMGSDAFQAFLSDYTQSNTWKISTTEILKETAETHCKCDLTPLFDEWIYDQ